MGKSILSCLVTILALSGCAGSTRNFSQAPGFRKYYARHPPRKTSPRPAERALLRRYRPRIFVAKGASGPVSFYRDYIAHGTLYDGAGNAIGSHVTRALLNRYKKDSRIVFVYRQPEHPRPHPVVFARIDHDTLPVPDRTAPRRYTFLTYNVVFPFSGLPAGMSDLFRTMTNIVGDADDWHQLDPYNAVTLALAPRDSTGALAPVAATFQQHNYLRTYLIGRRAAPDVLVLPKDGRIAVDAAIGSNELYPHRHSRASHRAVRFLNAATARYLVTGKNPPFFDADDVTEPAREVRYRLGFPAPADAFYTFQGWLGEHRALPGRDGPPGADYNELPAFKPKALQMVVFYWYEGARRYPKLLHELYADPRFHRTGTLLPKQAFKPFIVRFLERVKQLR